MKTGRRILIVILMASGLAGGLLVDRLTPLLWPPIALYTLPYLLGVYNSLHNIIKAIREGRIDIDILMVLAAIGAAAIGEYYEGSLLFVLFALSNFLQDLSVEKTRSAISNLVRLRPDNVSVKRNGVTEKVPLEKVEIGETVVLYPGERLGVDGTLRAGSAALDRSFITGESQIIAAELGTKVDAGTLILGGSVEVEVRKRAVDSTLTRIIDAVERARHNKTRVQNFLERYESGYAALVIGATIATFLVLNILGFKSVDALYRAITFMVALSPCAIIISTPVTTLSAIAAATRHGILFKGGLYLERAADIRAMACDKTGTLTTGRPTIVHTELVSSVVPAQFQQESWKGDRADLIALAASIEARSEHVLAEALVRQAQETNAALQEITSFRSIAGQGVEATIEGKHYRAGTLSFLKTYSCYGMTQAQRSVRQQEARYRTTIVVAQIYSAERARIIGVISFADVLRAGAPQMIAGLYKRNIEPVLISGDAAPVVRNIARATGIKQVYAEVRPEEKLEIIRILQQRYQSVAMFGDGVNDAPALAQANIGIAVGGAGIDVALETADIVLMNPRIEVLPLIIDLSREVRRSLVTSSIAISILMVCMGVATLLNLLPLPLAVVGHEGSTVLAALYGLRFLFKKRASFVQQRSPSSRASL